MLKAKGTCERVGLAAAGLLLALALAEFILRLGVLPQTPFERVLLAGKRTNPSQKILILGDSFLVHWETGYSLYELLVKGLEPGGVSLLNTAEGGFGPLDYLTALEAYGPSYRPNLVLLFYYAGNDLTSIQYRSAAWLWFKKHLKPWMMHSRLYYFFVERQEGWLRSRLRYEDSAALGVDNKTIAQAKQREINPWLLELSRERKNYLLDNLLMETEENRRAWEKTRDILADIDSRCRSLGARLLIVILPHTLQVNDSHFDFYRRLALRVDERTLTSERPQSLLNEFCAEKGIPCLDLLPSFRAERGKEWFRADDDHFNREGNELAGREVLSFLRARS